MRLIAATNEDLPRLAAEGKFRSDLLDRLAFDVITLPPLRERRDDILLLAERFAIDMSGELGREVFPGFSSEAVRSLLSHDWPGNIRELKNVVERCVYRTSPGGPVTEIVLDPFESPYRPGGVSQAEDAERKPTFPLDLKAAVRDFEIATIRRALDASRHNQRKAAEQLSLTYHQLRGYLKKYDILKEGG